MRILQIMPTVSFGDAVSSDARALHRVISEMGYNTGIYAENIDPRLSGDKTIDFVSELPHTTDEDIIIFHHSTGTKLCEMLPKIKGHKIMIYHNVTPPHFFGKYSSSAEKVTRLGYENTEAIRPYIEYVIADSEYNADELRKMGYECPIDVRPVLIPFADYEKTPDEEMLKCYSDGYVNIVFVGRIAPNKCQQDIIAAFAYYKKHIEPRSRLILVGSDSGMEQYGNSLKNYVNALSLDDVVFTGHISFPAILACYKAADVFLCMSEHEGFCVPLVEAMFFGVPIIAYDSSAVGGTLGGAGILTSSKNPVFTAKLIDRVVHDEKLKSKLISDEKKRLEDFSYEKVKALFTSQLKGFISKMGVSK